MTTEVQEQPLLTWIREGGIDRIPNGMIYKKAAEGQMIFFRDHIATLLLKRKPDGKWPSIDERSQLCTIAGWHTSKSITLPVYHTWNDTLDVTALDNFYSCNVTIRSLCKVRLPDYFHIDDLYDYCCVEGMKQHKLGKYADNQRRFTFCTRGDHYELYAVMRCIAGQTYDLGDECVQLGADPAAVGAWSDNRRIEFLKKVASS